MQNLFRRWRRHLGPAAALGVLLNLHPASLPGQSPTPEFREVHLGMEVRIAVAAPASLRLEAAVAAAFREIARLEAILSDWRRGSELNRLVDGAGEWTAVSPELAAVLGRALDVAEATDGAFDPTIGRLTLLWREERRTGVPASDSIRADARATVNWRLVQLDTNGLQAKLPRNGLRLDLGGIAKGWILGRARDTLAAHGYPAVLLEAGGDLLLGAPPPDAAGWRVLVATLHGDSVAALHDVAVATSGPAMQQFTDATGHRRSHVIDPATGLGIGRTTQVTVSGADGATTDAVATALTLLPASRWPALLARFGVRLLAVSAAETFR